MTVYTNYAQNPSFENSDFSGTGVNRFSGTGTLTQDAVEFLYGTKSAKYVSANLGTFEGIGASTLAGLGWTGVAQPLTVTAYVKGSGVLDVCGVRVYNTDASTTDAVFDGVTLTAGWVRYTSPPVTLNPAKIVDYVQLLFLRSVAAVWTLYVDGFMVERSVAASAYFDGATAAGGGFVYAWTGTPNASASTKTSTGLTTAAKLRRSNFELRPGY